MTILYYSGARVSSILELKKEDVKIDNGYLFLYLKAKKGGNPAVPKNSLKLPFMNFVKKQIKRTEEGQRIWGISRQSAWELTRKTLKTYPHHLRLSRSVKFLDDPSTTIPEMQSWFGWKSVQTINNYLGYSQRHMDAQGERLKRTL